MYLYDALLIDWLISTLSRYIVVGFPEFSTGIFCFWFECKFPILQYLDPDITSIPT